MTTATANGKVNLDDALRAVQADYATLDAPGREAWISRFKLGAMGVADPEAFELPALQIVSASEFAAVNEAGAETLVGEGDDALFAAGTDAMIFGDGGVGKTTTTNDLGCHMAAGEPWLGNPIARKLKVLIIEAEGPRPMFRRKLKRKMKAWAKRTEGRLMVLAGPWAEFTFDDDVWRERLAAVIREHEIDVVIVGPLTAVGMDDAGTLHQCREFAKLLEDTRKQSGRPVAIILVHHENKKGQVSGAWESVGDTRLHITSPGPERTTIKIVKARWSSKHHGRTLETTWAPDEGLKLKDARAYLDEIQSLYAERRRDGAPKVWKGKEDGWSGHPEWMTADDIALGIEAGKQPVERILKEFFHLFEKATDERARALGRRRSATLYRLTEEGE